MQLVRRQPLLAILLAAFGSILLACGGSSKDETAGSPVTAGAGGAGGAGVAAGGALVVGATGTGAGGAPCSAIGGTCTVPSDCCDEGALCNQTDQVIERQGCQLRCTASAECATGCCLMFQAQTYGLCTAAKWCACGAEGATCNPQEPACCDTHACAGNACRQKCTTGGECPTGCCVEIVTGLSVCLDRSYCPA
jgi:hypothetical protein